MFELLNGRGNVIFTNNRTYIKVIKWNCHLLIDFWFWHCNFQWRVENEKEKKTRPTYVRKKKAAALPHMCRILTLLRVLYRYGKFLSKSFVYGNKWENWWEFTIAVLIFFCSFASKFVSVLKNSKTYVFLSHSIILSPEWKK